MSDGEDILGGRVPASGLVGAKLLPGSIVTSASTFHVELHKVRFRKPFWELRLSELTGVYQVHDATLVSERERERKPVTYVTSQRGRVNARTVRESALAADLPSAVLEEGECSWM